MKTLKLKDELDDVQGIIVRGYGKLEDACYVLLEVIDPAAARAWLGQLPVTDGRVDPHDRALNIAFSHAGLARLGLASGALEQFSHEFQEGMVTPHRSRILGDHGANAPDDWEWGGPNNAEVHIVLLLYASTEAALATYCQEL